MPLFLAFINFHRPPQKYEISHIVFMSLHDNMPIKGGTGMKAYRWMSLHFLVFYDMGCFSALLDGMDGAYKRGFRIRSQFHYEPGLGGKRDFHIIILPLFIRKIQRQSLIKRRQNRDASRTFMLYSR